MFGRNAQAKQSLDDGLHLRVQSVFPTIQGEGPYAGRPALFIRLHGCNLRCTWCDTDFESRPQSLSIDSLSAMAATSMSKHPNPLVVITGGEPLLQNVVPLVKQLEALGIEVQIETAGSTWVPGLEHTNVKLVCSPKTQHVHAMIQERCRDWKYIVRVDEVDEQDGLPNKSTQAGHEGKDARLARPQWGVARIYLQPCEEYMIDRRQGHADAVPLRLPHSTHANTQLAVQLCLKHGYRLSLQTHKIVNVP